MPRQPKRPPAPFHTCGTEAALCRRSRPHIRRMALQLRHGRHPQPIRANLRTTSLRVLTWCCVILLPVVSLLPAQHMVRTGFPGRLEHFVAYAGSAAIAMAGYGASRGGMQIIGGFWVYAAVLEYLQHFSPGRHPSFLDFVASALGALCGGLAVALVRRRTFDQPG
jgi:VanZ family protein